MWYPHAYLFLILIFWCAIIQRISAHQQSYYHYPAPHQHQQFHETNLGITSNFEPSFVGAGGYYRTQQHQTTYQSPQLITQHYVPHQHQPMYYQQTYAATAPPSPPPTPAKIVKEFSSPQLESAAFTMALTRQGYVVVGNSHQPYRQHHHHQHNLNDARVVPQATSAAQRQQLATVPQPQISAAAATTATATAANTGRAFMTMMMMLMTTLPHSQNVKLPLPLGVTPLSFNPLPLQAGAPYSSVRGLTSYGTTYPQRRRR